MLNSVVNIPLQHVQELIGCFQLAAILRVQTQPQNIAYPTLTLSGVHQADADTQLLVATDELGLTALKASDNLLHHMKIAIDLVLSFRGGSVSKN